MESWLLLTGLCLTIYFPRCSSIRCMECTDVPSPTVCDQITTCPQDSLCHELGKRDADVKDPSKDVDVRDLDVDAEDPSKDVDACEECCSGDYCNIEGCGTKATDRSQRGPYCFECSVENDVYGCRNTRLCDIGYSCSLHKANFPGMYKASCIPDTECNNTHSQTNEMAVALIGKRSDPGITISLPYCCQGDFCNEIRQFVANASTAVDGEWAAWGDWSSCSASCGSDGVQSRSRSCDNPPPQNDGAPCLGNETMTRSCMVHDCPINGGWAAWTNWSSCSMSCGQEAYKARSRTCTDPTPQYNGALCQGNFTEALKCHVPLCPIDGAWSDWGHWSSCHATCGSGYHSFRFRKCDNPAPQHQGTACPGKHLDDKPCSIPLHCPVDGSWSSWGNWSSCSESCGDAGHQNRTRTCDNPTPNYGGANCNGTTTESRGCTQPHCPVDGAWSEWGAWHSCPGTCGTHMRLRNRRCDNPAPQYNGTDCPGDDHVYGVCHHTLHCPAVDGQWSDWGAWAGCSHTCGTDGQQRRNRTCNNPLPAHGGHACHGNFEEFADCNTNPCPVIGQWSDWSEWSACSHSCGSDGHHTRQRTCYNPHGGHFCTGINLIRTSCNHTACPVDGQWEEWGAWSTCTHSCGHEGRHHRTRHCTNPAPAYGGDHCFGPGIDTKFCNWYDCPVDGQWSEWGPWSSCSHSCGHSGRHIKERTCTNPAPSHGGQDCVGESRHVSLCNYNWCPAVDGQWSEWGEWSGCTHSCGSGQHWKRRHCNNPVPAHGGQNCSGSPTQTTACENDPCPVNWSEWTAWSACDHTCGPYGTITRHRTCDKTTSANTSEECSGESQEKLPCTNLDPCPVDGQWSDWGQWGQCTHSCGPDGSQSRQRGCTNPAPVWNGATCAGLNTDVRRCSTHHDCPGDTCTSHPNFHEVPVPDHHTSTTLCLSLVDHPASWSSARSQCQHSGGDLVTITSPAINTAISSFAQSHLQHGHQWFWVGFYAASGHHGGWHWVDHSHFNFKNFHNDNEEQQYQEHHQNHCGASGIDRDWWSEPCGDHYAFVCEIKV